MTLKNLLIWFSSTLLIGGLAGLLCGFLLQPVLGSFHWIDLLLLGLTFSSVSILGFFSYLVFQWLATGLLRTKKLYHASLIVLTVVVLGNILYLQMSQSEKNLWMILLVPILILIGAVIVTWLKVRFTNRQAMIPTFFFMVVGTALEAIPSLNPKDGELPVITVFFTLLILLICNAWQVLRLHDWVRGRERKSQTGSA